MNNEPKRNRNTRQKKIIISVLRNTKSHPNAEWIYDEVRKEIPNISLGTVYRNLRQLKETGDILEMNCSEKITRFDGDTREHYHFVCDLCGRVFDIPEVPDKAIEERVAKQTGFKITRHQLELHGLCVECQRSQPASA